MHVKNCLSKKVQVDNGQLENARNASVRQTIVTKKQNNSVPPQRQMPG